MALALTIGVVSLVAILAVATLSLAVRLQQNSTLAIRDARLDAGAASGLVAATDEWRERDIGKLAVGSSTSFELPSTGLPVAVSVGVTRVGPEAFWIVASASDGGTNRTENLLVRSRSPDPETLLGEDSTNTSSLGYVDLDSLAETAGVQIAGGAVLDPTSGFVHVRGDVTLLGGSGHGVLIVDGRLVIAGPLSYEGVIVARDGISVVEAGARVTGMIRAAGDPRIAGNLEEIRSAPVVQDVLLQILTPTAVAGRRWAELY